MPTNQAQQSSTASSYVAQSATSNGPISQQLAKFRSNEQQTPVTSIPPSTPTPTQQKRRRITGTLVVALLSFIVSGFLWQIRLPWYITVTPLLAFIIGGLIWVGYTPRGSKITGFSHKTLWDWANLLGVLLIPAMIAVGSIWFSVQQNATSLDLSQRQHESDRQIALDQQQETILINYQKDISDLLLTYKLGSSQPGDPVQIVARAKTITALRKLDPNRKGVLLQFLWEAKLIGGFQEPFKPSTRFGRIVDLIYADLSGVILRGGFLYGAELLAANLMGANLRGDNLQGVDLINANLQGADLSETDLSDTLLNGADLRGANLRDAAVYPEQLATATYLKGAILPDGSIYPSQSYPISHPEP